MYIRRIVLWHVTLCSWQFQRTSKVIITLVIFCCSKRIRKILAATHMILGSMLPRLKVLTSSIFDFEETGSCNCLRNVNECAHGNSRIGYQAQTRPTWTQWRNGFYSVYIYIVCPQSPLHRQTRIVVFAADVFLDENKCFSLSIHQRHDVTIH